MTAAEIRAELAQADRQIEADMHAALGTVVPLNLATHNALHRRIADMRNIRAYLHLELLVQTPPLTPAWFTQAKATETAMMRAPGHCENASYAVWKIMEQLEAMTNQGED